MTNLRTTMRRRFRFLLGAAACGALLASCGGSNDPTPTPTPTPSGTATPTPSPTPTPTSVNFDFSEDFAIGSSRAFIYAYFTPTGGTETFSDAARVSATAGVSFAVDPEVAQFAFPDLSSPVDFDAADLAGSTANSRTYVDGDERLVLERPFTNVLSAAYQRLDSGIVGTEPGDIRSTRVVVVLNPVTTTDTIDADISYTGTPIIDGGTPGTTPDGQAVGQATTLTVDASEDAVTGTLRIFEDSGSGPVQIAAFPVNADLSTVGTFTQGETTGSTLADNVSGFSGALSGFLAGPNREEAALVFSVSHEDGRKYVGHLIMQDTTP